MEHLSSALIRAARAMIGWSQADLARESNLGVRTVKRAEDQDWSRRADATDLAIRAAFAKAGVVFVSGAGDLQGRDVVAGVVLVRAPD